jgi:hypothetical protein
MRHVDALVGVNAAEARRSVLEFRSLRERGSLHDSQLGYGWVPLSTSKCVIFSPEWFNSGVVFQPVAIFSYWLSFLSHEPMRWSCTVRIRLGGANSPEPEKRS